MAKKWQFIPSRNRVCCNGRCITGNNISVFLLALFLIVVTAGLFFAFDCPYLAVKLSPTVPIFAGLLFLFALGCICRTAFSDPGILPRATPEEIRYLERLTTTNGTSHIALPGRVLEVHMAGGPTLQLKFCATCQLFRPPRVSHCSICDACIVNFDHHCPWVGNCVGLRNYRYFYLFLTSLSLLCVYIFAFNIVNFALRSQEKGTVADAIRDTPATLVEAIICFFSLWSVIGLWGYHSYLICRSVTTNEDIKSTWQNGRRGGEERNPFSRGNLFSNCFATLCGPLPPSLLDLRGEVDPQDGRGAAATFVYHSDEQQQQQQPMTNGKTRVWNSSQTHPSVARDFV